MFVKGKRVLVGVTGGIAAYKTAVLVRELVKEGALVKVAMTHAAQKFVTPLTFQILSGEEVAVDTFQDAGGDVLHVALGEWADLVIIAPATANIIGKLANGIADDFLSTCMLVTRAQVLICPAMNTNMLAHDAVQRNLDTLRGRGVAVLLGSEGKLACGAEGAGRMADVDDILEEAERVLCPKDMEGVRFLVTASRTEEFLDPVRCLTNRSSGRMGFAAARAARQRGGQVCLVTGPSEEQNLMGIRTVRVESARQMRDAVLAEFDQCDVVIKAAAVSDFRPIEKQTDKIKRGNTCKELLLEENPDILLELGRKKTHQCLVGFAAETQELETNAAEKIRKKNLDFIVANNVSQEGSGFQCSTNRVKILYQDGRIEALPMMEKIEVAHEILDRVRHWLEGTRQ